MHRPAGTVKHGVYVPRYAAQLAPMIAEDCAGTPYSDNELEIAFQHCMDLFDENNGAEMEKDIFEKSNITPDWF